jgi:hypothetical protein
VLLSRIFDIVAPESAPQVYLPPLAGVQHPLAAQIVDALRQHGNSPVGLWKLINALADTRQPDSRARRRCWRLRYWGACRELLKAKLLFRHGGEIATSNFATRPRPRSQRRLSPSVRRSVSKNGGSNQVRPVPPPPHNPAEGFEHELVNAAKHVGTVAPDTKSAPPTPAEISAAARQLALQPRKVKRPWTGYLAGERVKRGWLVQVPTGEVLPAYVVLRSKVIVALPDEPRCAIRAYERYDADQVRRVKLPEAALLGRLPPRPGRRPRGRPRRSNGGGVTAPTGDGVL